MSTTHPTPAGVGATPARTSTTSRSVPPAAMLAVLGALVVAYALWGWGAWLIDGPTPVTATRDANDVSWWGARVYEVLMAVVVVVLSIRIVRACLRERRLVLDGIIVCAGFFTMFWDPMVNWMQPNFMYSSQWLNLNTWTGHAPGVVNPTASLMPQPVFIMFIYPFGLLAFTMALNAAMSWAKRMWPRMGTLELLVFTYVVGGLLGMALEAPAFLLNLWGLPGAPDTLALFDDLHRFPWAEYATTAVVFATFGAVRYFKNDKGQTIGERGLAGLGERGRAVVSVLATTAIFSMSMWILLLIQIPAGLHASPYPARLPDHMVNELCSVRADQPTAYGPCPGSPGFRMPVSQTFVP